MSDDMDGVLNHRCRGYGVHMMFFVVRNPQSEH